MLPKELLDMMLAIGDNIAATSDPLEAEVLASTLGGLWYGGALIDADAEQVFGGGLLEAAARRRTPASFALTAAVGAVTDAGLGIRAATVAQAMVTAGAPAPPWLDEIGAPALTRCFQSSERSGDATSIVALFAYDGRPEHALMVLIDHNLGGIAKDAWVTPTGTEVVERYEKVADEGLSFASVRPAVARALVEQAFARTDRVLPYEPPISDELRSHRALALARMRLLPDAENLPEPEPLDGHRMDVLLREFEQSPEARAVGDAAPVDRIATQIADFGNRVDRGQPLRVSAVKAELLLTDWLPRYGDLHEAEAPTAVRVLEAWYRWSARRTHLPDAIRDDALKAVRQYGGALAEGLRSGVSAQIEDLVDLDERYLDVWSRTDLLQRRAFAVPQVETGPDAWIDRGNERDRSMLIEQAHPQHADALHDHSGEVDGERMHIVMHEIIASQLWINDPPRVWQTAQRLMLGYDDLHEIHHMLAGAMAESLHGTLVSDEPFDRGAYLDRLEALPGSWEAARR